MSQCQAEIKRLQAENIRLKKIIARAASLAYQVASDSAKQMKEHHPRGKWSYLKGSYNTAAAIYRRLGT